VEAALVDATADAVRWSDHFDFAGGASPQLADEIVTMIIRPLVLVLEQEEANRAAAKEPAEQTADDLVWRGAAAFDRPLSQTSRGEARELFEKALALDPRNVWALSRLAHVDITDVMNDPGPEDEAKLAHAEQLLDAAASIGRNDMTRYARCMLLRLQARFDEAISICGEVIGNLTTRAFVYKEIGLDYLFLGQLEQAVTAFETADRLSRGHVYCMASATACGVQSFFSGKTADNSAGMRKTMPRSRSRPHPFNSVPSTSTNGRVAMLTASGKAKSSGRVWKWWTNGLARCTERLVRST